jgi:hypothetical protein
MLGNNESIRHSRNYSIRMAFGPENIGQQLQTVDRTRHIRQIIQATPRGQYWCNLRLSYGLQAQPMVLTIENKSVIFNCMAELVSNLHSATRPVSLTTRKSEQVGDPMASVLLARSPPPMSMELSQAFGIHTLQLSAVFEGV